MKMWHFGFGTVFGSHGIFWGLVEIYLINTANVITKLHQVPLAFHKYLVIWSEFVNTTN